MYVVFRFFCNRNDLYRRTKTKFDDLLVNKTAKYIAHLIPLLFIYKSVPVILQRYEYWEGLLEN
jgi:miniconductance mechanosensitive channel